jgi:hypothetical protein
MTTAQKVVMKGALLSRIIWSILGVLSLNAIVILQATPVSPLHPAPVPSSAIDSPANETEVLFQQTSSVSRELSLRCEQQSKQAVLLLSAPGFYPLAREKAFRSHTVMVQGFFPVPIQFPRKVSPPTNENDPFFLS